MEIGEVMSLSVKPEPNDEEQHEDNRKQTCLLCSKEVPEMGFWEHVKCLHGFIEVEYQSLAKSFDAPELYEAFKGRGTSAEDGITDGCKFKCKYCDHESISWRKMTKHLRTHNTNIKKVHDPFELLVDHKMYECSVCKMPLLQDRIIVYHHMFGAHKIRAPQRLAKNPLLVKNECKFQCRFCPQVSDCWDSTLRHHRMNHKSLGKVPIPHDTVVKSKIHNCHICGRELLKDNRIINNHLYTHRHRSRTKGHKEKSKRKCVIEEPDIVPNECEFKCKYCRKVYTSWKSMANHLQGDHGSKRFVPVPYEYVTETVFHTCCLCKKEVLNDDMLVYNHISYAHGLTSKSYKKWLKFLYKIGGDIRTKAEGARLRVQYATKICLNTNDEEEETTENSLLKIPEIKAQQKQQKKLLPKSK